MRIDWNNIASITSIPAITNRPRLDPAKNDPDLPASSPQTESLGQPTSLNTSLTESALRAVLMELGVAADLEAIQLAEVFTRLGLPLTEPNITEGRTILARYPKLPAAAYAMAKILDAPLTPGVLRALSRVIDGAISKYPLPDSVLNDLSLALDGRADSKQLARDLYRIISQLGQSTEHRLLKEDGQHSQIRDYDPRAQLLTLSHDTPDRAIKMAADVHAGHIEGQQLLNQIAINRFDPPVPLYFAFPFRLSEVLTVTAEVQVWTREDERSDTTERDDDTLVLQAILRIAPPKLGLIEVRLSGRSNATLTCQILAEQASTSRLLRRHSGELTIGLAKSGWHITQIDVGMAKEFVPLWYGGAALTQPRGRVDQKV